ncbi:MAG: single-stranded-DNA-specific exonuclease RecJ [Bacteroidetes bacterium RIFCSPLOWO2_02_FULL_36_8]|nr:MAG: single-stranded-DNA-specific exonuclease RecJ [Bacteroidetes bacterium RIFCSPLOWO2_02_FULL_36_8]OFY70474.1 MAG: single-stranded-DNA-specific exonuclease RecJ [Bacteroidetes bacterium RIFCSPLOWO2_12_FULL_37_12]
MKTWKIKPLPNPELVQNLAQQLKLNVYLTKLLIQRGINTPEEAQLFFHPDLSHLHDPFLMKGMDKAVARISTALNKKEKILVYGDYDVDGTTSIALMVSYLKSQQATVEFYTPDRYKEGYGVSLPGIVYAKEKGVTLIISLDCGINAHSAIQSACDANIDFIVCDHHLPDNILPPALAILDPKQPECHYPFKELSGCGIGFKLIQALAISKGFDIQTIKPWLDLVTLSIASDIVPVTGENRILSAHGLKIINSTPRPGIRALLDMLGKKSAFSISDLVFGVGPKINAAGRISSARLAVDLLMADEMETARKLAIDINTHNDTRKEFDADTTFEALELLKQTEGYNEMCTTVIYHPEWQKGVIGIVASRLIEHHYRPTIVLTKSNGVAVGSARSVAGFDIYQALSSCKDLLIQYGGHKYAAGLTISTEKIPEFIQKFDEEVTKKITKEQLVSSIEIDLKINLSQILPDFVRKLSDFEPYGPGNMAPVFMSETVYDSGFARKVGSNHLKMVLRQENSISFDGIAFGMAEHYPYISRGIPFNACYCVEENEWNGRRTVQLNVKDVNYTM